MYRVIVQRWLARVLSCSVPWRFYSSLNEPGYGRGRGSGQLSSSPRISGESSNKSSSSDSHMHAREGLPSSPGGIMLPKNGT